MQTLSFDGGCTGLPYHTRLHGLNTERGRADMDVVFSHTSLSIIAIHDHIDD